MSRKHKKDLQQRNLSKINKDSFGKKRRNYSFGFLAGDY